MVFRKERVLGLVLLCLSLIQCNKDSVENTAPTETNVLAGDADTTKSKSEQKKVVVPKVVIPEKEFSYTALPFKANDSLRDLFKKQYKGDSLYIVLALNRLDKKNMWRADTLLVPSKIETDFLKYSPFPGNIPILSEVKKFVFFSYPIQAFGVYENGNLKKWGPTSMGKKKTQTDRGLHFSNWKKEIAISTSNDEWKLRWNFNISNFRGIGWHQYELPGYPASHSCLRMLEEDAHWMYTFADSWILAKGGATVRANGTPVIVYGDYAWGKQKPWYKLATDPKANDMSVDVMTKIIQPELDKILQEQKNREDVLLQVAQEKLEQAKADSLGIKS